ncbi:hypothetical protein COO60DRAFT_619103 [Scenedesmus sp. NREL 46B-D3]|nr:hypothetical protein COO60DRAFT_619103 [Scenedesmus sp. NREL 46B-D3]
MPTLLTTGYTPDKCKVTHNSLPIAQLALTFGPSRTSCLPQLRFGQRARLEVPPCSAPAAKCSSKAGTCCWRGAPGMHMTTAPAETLIWHAAHTPQLHTHMHNHHQDARLCTPDQQETCTSASTTARLKLNQLPGSPSVAVQKTYQSTHAFCRTVYVQSSLAHHCPAAKACTGITMQRIHTLNCSHTRKNHMPIIVPSLLPVLHFCHRTHLLCTHCMLP